MDYKREEEILSAIAQSITGNHSLMVKVSDQIGCTDGNTIYVGNDEILDDFFKVEHDNFLMRLKLMVHETLHCVYTPFRSIAGEVASFNTKYPKTVVFQVFNMLEDILIESQVRFVFSGWLLDGFKYGCNIAKANALDVDNNSPLREWFNACIQYRESLNADDKKIKGTFTSSKAKTVFECSISQFNGIDFDSRIGTFHNIATTVLSQLYEAEDSIENLNISEQKNIDGKRERIVPPSLEKPEYSKADNLENESDNNEMSGNNNNEMPGNKKENGNEKEDKANKKEGTNAGKIDSNTDKDYEDKNSNADKGHEGKNEISRIKREVTKFSNSFTSDKEVNNFDSLKNNITNDLKYKDIVEDNKSIIKTLESTFRKELKRQKNETMYGTSGKYDPLKASVDGHRTVEVFKTKRAESEEKDAALLISLDESGSMAYDGRKEKSVELAVSIIESLKNFKEIKVQMEGWFTECHSHEVPKINLYKSFDSKHNTCVLKALRFRNSVTPLGFALVHANKAFAKRRENNKVFLMITDGVAECEGTPQYENKDFIRKEIRKMKKQGIEPIILVIGDNESFSYYHNLFGDHFISVDDGNKSEWIKKVAIKLKKAAKAF